MRIYCEIAHHLSARKWTADHENGLVPSRLPFGLDELAVLGHQVHVREPLEGLVGRAAVIIDHRIGRLQWVEEAAVLASRMRRSADVILCWDEYNGIPAAMTPRPGRPPVVGGLMNLTDWLLPTTPAFERMMRRAIARMDRTFVHSASMIPVLVEEWGLDPRRVREVPLGVDPEFFRFSDYSLATRGRIVSVGDDRHRDYPGLVMAIDSLRGARPEVQVDIATEIPVTMPPGLGTITTEKLGPRRPAYYSAASVVAISARPNFHGSGLTVLLEAMSSGRPYVVTEGVGLTGYVDDGVTGLVVPPGDPAAMAAAIDSLLADPAGAAELGRNGRRAVESRFSSFEQAKVVAEVLAEVAT